MLIHAVAVHKWCLYTRFAEHIHTESILLYHFQLDKKEHGGHFPRKLEHFPHHITSNHGRFFSEPSGPSYTRAARPRIAVDEHDFSVQPAKTDNIHRSASIGHQHACGPPRLPLAPGMYLLPSPTSAFNTLGAITRNTAVTGTTVKILC